MTAADPPLVIYSRPGCHLCEVLVEELVPRVRGRVGLEVRNIDTDADWQMRYGERIPVVEYRGEFVCQYRLDVVALESALAGGTARPKSPGSG